MFVYLFEAKSIQSYLFQSGKLKDVISASERLDRLIDNHPDSVLAKVIQESGLYTDLLETNETPGEDAIFFIRCKGGAFYAWSYQQAPLLQLRSLWSLAVQQLFPGLRFCDALCSDDTLASALQKGHQALASARNLPVLPFPVSSAPCVASARTGFAAIPLSSAAAKEIHYDDDPRIDIDTELHRQCYRFLSLRHTPLLNKFSGRGRGSLQDSGLPDNLKFPLDSHDFYCTGEGGDADSRDLALIHIDGNGLGKQLRALRQALENQSESDFSRAFRQFSDALATATELAAAEATLTLYQKQCQLDQTDSPEYIAMRPLVLGGDDITLLCRAELALQYAETFCRAFQKHSGRQLQSLHKKYLPAEKNLLPYLTASGGVLYHKMNHPFMLCHHLVEGLCVEAKQLTKSMPSALPAALSFYRISKALADDITALRSQSQQWYWKEKPLRSSLLGYLVPEQASASNSGLSGISLTVLQKVTQFLRQTDKYGRPLPLSINKFRQMATELGRGDDTEACHIYTRAIGQLTDSQRQEWMTLLYSMMPANNKDAMPDWLWVESDEQHQTVYRTWISDLLIYNHFLISDREFSV